MIDLGRNLADLARLNKLTQVHLSLSSLAQELIGGFTGFQNVLRKLDHPKHAGVSGCGVSQRKVHCDRDEDQKRSADADTELQGAYTRALFGSM